MENHHLPTYNYVEQFPSISNYPPPNQMTNSLSSSSFYHNPNISFVEIKPLETSFSRRRPTVSANVDNLEERLKGVETKVKEMEFTVSKMKQLMIKVSERVGLDSGDYLNGRDKIPRNKFTDSKVATRP